MRVAKLGVDPLVCPFSYHVMQMTSTRRKKLFCRFCGLGTCLPLRHVYT